jgi:formylglycine-generating enzyme required for sulfatase activity
MTEKDGNFSPPTFVRELMRAFAGAKTSDVGVYTANPWGLYDMHGNVWEWVEDVWHENYKGAPTDGCAGLSSGDKSGRVMRGGSWGFSQRGCRSAYRLRCELSIGNDVFGFRVARTL